MRLYTLFFYLALPFVVLRLLWRARKAPAYAKRMRERFGYFAAPEKKHGIWIHAVSLGEAIAAEPLINALQKKYPDRLITVTTTTPTGSARVQHTFGERVFHVYFPYDIPGPLQRFLNRVQPSMFILIETELWPNTLYYCAQRTIPVMLANARLSARSAKRYARFAQLSKTMLQQINIIAVQNKADAERFIQLGAHANEVHVVGSVKFDITIPADLREQAKQFRAEMLGQNRFIWIAASTHEGEEEFILHAFAQLREANPDALLLLVPRHPERFDAVAKLCQQCGYEIVRRSEKKACQASTSVFLGDTMGELLFFYASADIAFVGGSLIERGGHNPLEPAALHLPIICGPHTFNFAVITTLLQQANALTIVSRIDELAQAILTLAQDETMRTMMGAHAAEVVAQNRGALARHMQLIEELIARVPKQSSL